MRILVYPHDLAMGGSQINAIDLAAEIQRAGHDVVVYGQPGVLVDRIQEAGLEFIASPRIRLRPTPSVVADLRGRLRSLRIDVVHGYEWPPTLEALLACRGTGATAVSTVLSMSVAPFIPHYMPLLVGTEQIMAAERGVGRTQVELMEPPIDTRLNAPDVDLPLQRFHRDWGLDPEAFTVVVVSRLAHEMKLEGILSAVEAVQSLSAHHRVQLVIVGGGTALEEIRDRARRVNAAVQARAVVVTGELLDPRPAYALADAVLGMGSSALRGMAFGKPLIVQGIHGFWEPLTDASLPTFLWQGWYGHGHGTDGAVEVLTAILEQLIDDPALRQEMGRLSLRTVRDRFSLQSATERQLAFYERALALGRSRNPLPRMLRSDVIAAARYLGHHVHVAGQWLTGASAVEDFNSAAHVVTSPTQPPERPRS